MFGPKKREKRTCPQGHELEESWERCPLCTAAEKKEKEERDESRRAVKVSKPPAAERRLAGWLVAIGGEQDGVDFRLREGRNVLGKGEKCDVILKDAHVSERHAVVEYRGSGGTWTIEDLESKHGTWLNGDRLEGDGRSLGDADRIRVGRTDLFFRAFAPKGHEPRG